MDKELIDASQVLLKKLDSIERFNSNYKIFNYNEATQLLGRMQTFAQNIPSIETPQSNDELVQAEIKRLIQGSAATLEQRLSGRHYDFDSIISMYGIPTSDLDDLRPWLEQNKSLVLETIDRLYRQKENGELDLDVSLDIPSVRNEAEILAQNYISKYHKVLGKQMQNLSLVGEFLRDIDATPTTAPRSYFNSTLNKLAIGIPAICFTTQDGNLEIREKDLIRLYGHEGMGHAVHQVLTKRSNLPYALKNPTSLTTSTAESIAQFYEKIIFEDLRNSPDVQRKLNIYHKFDEMYQETLDTNRLNEYQLKFTQYAIKVLADKTLGDPNDPNTIQKKLELLQDLSIDPSSPMFLLEDTRNKFDSQGNLDWQTVSELRYAAKPVQRALSEFEKQGINYEDNRSAIDQVLLTGFWTPIGYVDNARIHAAKLSNEQK